MESRQTKRVQEKIRDIYKRLYTRQIENLKRRLGKKGYLGGLKTERAVQEKVRELKRMIMFRWIILRTTCKLGSSDQFNQLRTRQQIDKMLRDTEAIAEWEPHGIITHSYLFFVSKF